MNTEYRRSSQPLVSENAKRNAFLRYSIFFCSIFDIQKTGGVAADHQRNAPVRYSLFDIRLFDIPYLFTTNLRVLVRSPLRTCTK
jgi:hypothetical protein